MQPSSDVESKRLLLADGRSANDLPDDAPATCVHCSRWASITTGRPPLILMTAVGLLFLVLALTSGAMTAYLISGPLDSSAGLYSPVNHLVEYVPVTFNRSRGDDKTLFQGWPTDEIDQTWTESYLPGMLSAIDAETAGLLPEKTERLPVKGRENEFVITLDVFHQMHCLDVVRMALYRDRYDKHFYLPNGTVDYCKWLHVDHCLDQVRQALLCNADVSVVYFSWSDTVQGLRPRVDNKHTCKNYNRILDWAKRKTVRAKQWHPSRRVIPGQDGSFSIQQGRNHALNGEGECNAI